MQSSPNANKKATAQQPCCENNDTFTNSEESIFLPFTKKNDPYKKYDLTRSGKYRRMYEIFSILKRYDIFHNFSPKRFRHMLEELGPTFVKTGQILSTRSEILPQEYRDELSLLRANVQPMPFETVLSTLQTEYRCDPYDIFSHINQKPLGSASIAQVHKATLLNGDIVAIKVQRPGVQKTMARDLDIMRSFSHQASHFIKTEEILDLESVIDELWASFQEETNFLVEANNLKEFYATHRHNKKATCPQPYMAYCTEHVVVMEYIQGISINHPEKLTEAGYSLKALGASIVDDYATQVLDDGFFHADPHAGNIVFNNGVVYFIDLGMMGRISSYDRKCLRDIIYSVAEGNTAKLKDALIRFSVDPDIESIDHSLLLTELDNVVAEYAVVDLEDLDIGAFLTSIINLAQRNKIKLPSVITLVSRGLLTLEGLLSEYMPNINMLEIIQNHIKLEKSTSERIEETIEQLGLDSILATKSGLGAAKNLDLVMTMLTRGQLKVNAEMIGSQDLIQHAGKIMDRLSLAVVIAGLFVGSSIVYYAGIHPVIMGIPVLGFLGYTIALILALLLGRDIYRNSKGKFK